MKEPIVAVFDCMVKTQGVPVEIISPVHKLTERN